MPYNKRKQKCKQSSGKAGNYVLSYTDKKGKKHRACHTSEKNMQGQIAAIEAEADEAYGEEINEDIMRILVGDFTIPATLKEKKEVKYKASCAYEIKINRILENAGLRGPYTFDSSKAGFCFGTGAGADSEFMNAAGKVFNMELKDGSGQGAAPMEDVFRQPAIEILAEVSSYNTVENIETIIKAQVSKGNFQGLNISRSKTHTDLELTENDIRVLATEIQSRQEAQITEAKNALSKPGAKIPGVSLYYYFGRIDRSTSSLGFSVIPAGTFSDREAGVSIDSWSSHYAANNTYYIHIGQGGGLYYMSSDPANLSLPVKDGGLGIPNFQSNVNLSSRLRFDASSGKSPVGGAGYPDIVTESGVSIKLYGRLFGFSPTVDLGSFTASPINIEDPKSIPRIKKALGYPANMEESIARVFLEEALLLEATKGDKYEKNLISASQSNPHPKGFYLDESETNPSTGKPTLAYDLSVKNENGDIVSTVEVKLNSSAQLGKLGKKYFKSLTYTVGGEFDCVPNGSDTTADLLLTVFDSLNKIEKSLERMDNFCVEALGKSPGDIVDLTTTYPIPRGTKLSSPKQITSSSKVVNLRIPGEKLVAYHAPKKDYFILGFNEIDPKGIFCVLGEDKLNLFKSGGKMNFGEVNVEIKWGSKSGKAEPNPSHSFVIETRASDPNILDGSMGYRFSNGKQLNDIINGTYTGRMQSIHSRETERASGLDNIASQSAQAALDNPYHPLHISDVKKFLGKIIKEILEDHISDSDTRLIIEELTGADKSEIKRMIAKEIEGASNKRETKKIFQAEFDKNLKKSLGVSFIGTPGKINKFVSDTIKKEIETMFKGKETQEQVAEITKSVMKKLYRELSFSSVQVIDRIKM